MSCAICAAGTELYLCANCIQRFRRILTNALDVDALLAETRTRQDRLRSPQPGGKSHERPLPFNDHAAHVQDALSSTLAAWARYFGYSGTAQAAPAAGWLSRNASAISAHPEAGNCFQAVADAVDVSWAAVDREPRAELRGECPTCRGDLVGKPGATELHCVQCASVVGASENLDRVARELSSRWLPATAAIDAVNVLYGKVITPKTLYNLARTKVRCVDRRYAMADLIAHFDAKQAPSRGLKSLGSEAS